MLWKSSVTRCRWLTATPTVSLSLFVTWCHAAAVLRLAHTQSGWFLAVVERKCVLLCLCRVLVQVIIWRAAVRVFHFPSGDLSSGPDGSFTCQNGELFLVSLPGAAFVKGCIIKRQIHSSVFSLFTEHRQEVCVCYCLTVRSIGTEHASCCCSKPYFSWMSSCQQPGLTKHSVDKLNKA